MIAKLPKRKTIFLMAKGCFFVAQFCFCGQTTFGIRGQGGDNDDYSALKSEKNYKKKSVATLAAD